MTTSKLALTTRKNLAQKIRKLVEPEGAKSKTTIKEIEIRRLFKQEVNVIITGISEVIAILETNYNEKTVARLISKIQPSVVWDASICNLEIQQLQDLFYDQTKNNIFTNLTVDELDTLTHNTSSNHEKAKFLCHAVSQDNESTFSTTVTLFKNNENSYVDTVLLKYCQINNYALYTHDYRMGLRAKSKHIDVTIFNNIDFTNIPKYTPSTNSCSKHILLHSDLLNNSISLQNILSIAEKINGGKFILTTQFIEKLEKIESNELIREFIHFFLYDENSEYTIYLSESECEEKIVEIAQKYNAIIFTSNIKTAIYLKSIMCKYEIILSDSTKAFIEKINYQTSAVTDTSKQDNSKQTSSEQDIIIDNNKKICKIPYYIYKTKSISLKRVKLNEKIWIFNAHEQIIPTKCKFLKLSPNNKIIYGLNHLNEYYEIHVINIINVVESYKNKLMGEEVFSAKFSKDTVNTIPSQYRYYANSLILST